MKTKSAQPALAIAVKRVYEPPTAADGPRFLVERLWPRGVRKAALKLDAWLRDVAPSTELRQWFSHDPARWAEFQRRYQAELDARTDAWQPILTAAENGPVTLLFSSHDAEHNNVVALAPTCSREAGARHAASKPARSAQGRIAGPLSLSRGCAHSDRNPSISRCATRLIAAPWRSAVNTASSVSSGS